jgi:hypothetical protein
MRIDLPDEPLPGFERQVAGTPAESVQSIGDDF